MAHSTGGPKAKFSGTVDSCQRWSRHNGHGCAARWNAGSHFKRKSGELAARTFWQRLRVMVGPASMGIHQAEDRRRCTTNRHGSTAYTKRSDCAVGSMERSADIDLARQGRGVDLAQGESAGPATRARQSYFDDPAYQRFEPKHSSERVRFWPTGPQSLLRHAPFDTERLRDWEANVRRGGYRRDSQGPRHAVRKYTLGRPTFGSAASRPAPDRRRPATIRSRVRAFSRQELVADRRRDERHKRRGPQFARWLADRIAAGRPVVNATDSHSEAPVGQRSCCQCRCRSHPPVFLSCRRVDPLCRLRITCQ